MQNPLKLNAKYFMEKTELNPKKEAHQVPERILNWIFFPIGGY
jgi:hypothetical protein